MPTARPLGCLLTAGFPDFLGQERVAHHHCNTEQNAEDDEDDLEYYSGSTEVQRSCGWKTEAPGYVEAGCDDNDGYVVSVARVDGRLLVVTRVDVFGVERIEDDEDDSQNEKNATHQE